MFLGFMFDFLCVRLFFALLLLLPAFWWIKVNTTVWVLWDADFRCFRVTLPCLATSVFVEKNLKALDMLKRWCRDF